MALVLIDISLISIVAVVIMIGALFLAYLKKWMMTYTLMITNFVIFIITMMYRLTIIHELGFRPLYILPEYLPNIHVFTLFSSMFLHAGFLHIFGNMLIFFFIGIAFEQRIGWKKFLAIYLISGVFAAVFHSIVTPLVYPGSFDATIPLVGASGAIFGIMGAFAFSYPQDKVVMPIPMFIVMIMKIRVIVAVFIFIGLETVITFVSGGLDSTAHFAHFGGLIGGMILAAFLIRNKTHDKKGQTIFYDETQVNLPENIDYNSLEELATTPQLKKIFEKIKNENLSEVQKIWLDHLIEKSRCPKCGSNLKDKNRKIICENCDFKTKY